MVKNKAKTEIKKKPRKITEPIGPLGIRAQKICFLAEQIRDRQTTKTNLETLQNRKSQFKGIADEAESLIDTVHVFRSNGNEVSLMPIIPILEKAILFVSELSDRYRNEPQSARQALKQQIDTPIKPLEETLLHIWIKITQPEPGAVTLSHILNNFPQFKATCQEIQDFRKQLEELSRTLPRNQNKYNIVLDLQTQLHQRIEQLKNTGIDSEVQIYLQKLAAGVTLNELLKKPTVLEFLKNYNLLSSLMVSFRP